MVQPLVVLNALSVVVLLFALAMAMPLAVSAALASVLAFMLVYGASIIAMTMLLAASGMEIVTAFSAVIASINNTGPGLNEVGPASNYASLTGFQTWLLAFAMLLGRLELITPLVVLTPAFWRR